VVGRLHQTELGVMDVALGVAVWEGSSCAAEAREAHVQGLKSSRHG
jgi:hypothetical protein